jgi:RHS repeat-associated protein
MCLLFSGIRWLPCYVFSAFMQSPEQPVRQVRCDRFSRDEGKEAGIGLYGLISSIPLLLLFRLRRRLLVACLHQMTAVALIPLLLVTCFPSNLFAFTIGLEPSLISPARPALENPPTIKVNRTVPQVTPPSSVFSLPSPATTADLENARLFPEALVPVNGRPTASDNAALAAALEAFAPKRDVTVLEAYVGGNAGSPWLVSVLTNLGLLEYQDGYFSKALADWNQAWTLGKNAGSPAAQAIVNRAVAELIRFYSRIGRVAEAQALLAELDQRSFRGMTSNMIGIARQSVATMQLHPKDSFKCGPYALANILNFLHQQTPKTSSTIKDYATTAQGTSLDQVLALANQLGMKMQAAKRVSGTALPLPAVVNWKLNHYGALLQQNGNRYLLVDPTFGSNQWVLQTAIAQEASGYFLIPVGPLPAGWVAVGKAEAETVWGRGNGTTQQGGQTGCGGKKLGTSVNPCGMAHWVFDAMLASLNITDTPLVYQPPVGPEIAFSVNYDAMEQNQPATINYSNLGPLWNLSWLSTITFDSANAYVNMGSGGYEDYSNFNATTQSYDPDPELGSVLVEVSATDYERRAMDGSKMVFALADPSGRLYLTQNVDRYGNAVTMTYDSNFRLVSVTDAIGQVTTLTYGSNTVGNAQFYLITKVTDPFGRYASFSYNSSNQLSQITDEIGINSQFAYTAGDFIHTLTTPYGTTTFTLSQTSNPTNGFINSLLAVEPGGAQQRIDAVEISTVTPDAESVTPAGMPVENEYLEYRNSYYWDREAMHDAPGDYTKASLTHFLHYLGAAVESGIVESTKEPLENRVWYFYQNQQLPLNTNTGMIANPIDVGRVLDDGTTQLFQASYSPQGFMTQNIDPAGRTTNYTYAANGIDLLTVARVHGTGSDLLATFTYNNAHLPLTATGPDGETSKYTYNAQGRPLTFTDAKNEVTTATYTNGYLTTAQGPLAGTYDHWTYTYDGYGRIQTATDGEGYVFTYAYDNLSRLTSTEYPDGTSDQTVYTYLLPTKRIDRLNRTTTFVYNSLQQLVSVTDPLNRVTQYARCTCGALLRLIDPMNRTTSWTYDVEGRPTAKTFADGSTQTIAYENTTSRVKSLTDTEAQTKLYSYNLDNTVAGINYVNAQQTTAPVTFAYDPAYIRLVSATDGIGTTNFTYVPVTGGVSLGANLLASCTGPWNNSQVAYAYDQLGRVLSRSINGVAQTVTYDALGRVPTVTNALGAFSYTFENASERILKITRPNAETSNATYFGNTSDRRLEEIQNLNVAGSNLSEFNYASNAVGDITTWSQATDANPAVSATLAYDAGDQLTSSSATSQTYGYTYDPAANRLTQTVNGTTTTAAYNALNQLRQVTPALGNDKTYLWDAENRLVKILYTGTNLSTQLSYDGFSRCAQIQEFNGTSITSTKRFVWCGSDRCEVHDAQDNVTGRFFEQGEQISGTNYFYARDQLGSIREMTDSSGALHARYSYDPYGTRTKVSGDLDASLGFTGLYYHANSNLQLAYYRAYDSATGRWLNRDPLGEDAGGNLYAYVGNNPIARDDPSGLCTAYVGLGGGVSLPGISYSFGAGIGFDDSGNVVPYWSEGGGVAGGAGANFGVQVGTTNAPTFEDTIGPSATASASVGDGIGGGIDLVAGRDLCGRLYTGSGVNAGVATGGGFSGGISTTHKLGNGWNPWAPDPDPPTPPEPPPHEPASAPYNSPVFGTPPPNDSGEKNPFFYQNPHL